MAEVKGFDFNKTTGNIKMRAGDTGSCLWGCAIDGGGEWPSTGRGLWTVTGKGGEIMMQRIYRFDDQYDLGDGWILMEFHNNDTDTWSPGTYDTEWRFDLNPTWDGTPSTARCVNALADGAAHMVEGVPVRTKFRGTLIIDDVLGRI